MISFMVKNSINSFVMMIIDYVLSPEMAEHLGLPQITYVCDAKLMPNGNLQVHKENEDSVQVLEVEGKCLLTVLASAFEARYMTVSGIVEAYNREV